MFGLEADFQLSGMKRSFTNLNIPANVPVGPGPTLSVAGNHKVPWFGSLRPRVGFLITPATLLYATGGLGIANSSYRVFAVDAGGNNVLMNSKSTRIGWVAGAGIEHKFNSNWSAKLEYQYHSYGKKGLTGVVLTAGGVPNGVTTRTTMTPNFHTVRLGLNYQFGGPSGGVVAKY